MTLPGGGDDNSNAGGPPEGVLAAALEGKLTDESPEQQNEQPSGVAAGQRSSLDPDYIEPLTSDEINEMLLKANLPPGFHAIVVGRLKAMEEALLPFAVKASLIANARIVLDSQQDFNSPAGGTWIHGPQQIHMQRDELVFFSAADAYGRKRVEDRMIAEFERLKAGKVAAIERDAHIEAGGKTH